MQKKKVAKKRIKEPPFMLKEIKVVPINSVKLWADNPRINDEAVPKLAEILRVHGIRSPIVVWRKDRVIYKGNTTWKAAKSLGWRDVPVAFVDFLSEAAAKAYGIADNKSQEYSEWDEELLGKLLSSDAMQKFHPVTGFEETELNGFMLRPDISKLHKIKETSSGLKAIIKIICEPEKKEEVIKFLSLVLQRKYGDSVRLK